MSDVNVKVTGDVADLVAKLALARENLQRMQATLTATAAEMNKAGAAADSALRDKMKAAAQATAAATAEVKQLGAALKEATKDHEGLSLATAGTTREFIVLGHETLTGNFNRIPGSILVLLERMGSLHTIVEKLGGAFRAMVSPVALVVAAVGGLAAALIAVEASAARAKRAIEETKGFVAAGGFNAQEEEIKALGQTFLTLPNATKEMRQKVIDDLYSVQQSGKALRDVLLRTLPGVATRLGEDLPAASRKMAEALNGDRPAMEEFIKRLRLSEQQTKEFEKALVEAGGSHNKERIALLEQLIGVQQRYEDVLHKSTEKQEVQQELQINSGQSIDFPDVVNAGEQVKQRIETVRTDWKNALDDARKESEKGILGSPDKVIPTTEFKEKISEWKSAHDSSQRDMTKYELDQWRERLAATKDNAKLNEEAAREVAKLELDLKKQTGAQEIENTRVKNSAIVANDKLSVAEKAANESKNWKELLNGEKLTVDQRKQVQILYNESVARLTHETQAEQIRAAQIVTDDMKRGTAARIAAAENEYAIVTRFYKQNSAEEITARKRVQDAENAFREQSQRDDAKLAQEKMKTALDTIDTEEKRIQQKSALDKTQALDTLQQLIALEQRRKQVLDEGFAAEIAAWQGNSEKIKEILERRAAEIQKVDTKIVGFQTQAAQQTSKVWETQLRPFQNAVDSTFDQLINRQQGWREFASGLVRSFVSEELRMLTQRVFNAIISEQALSAANAAGNAERTANTLAAGATQGAAEAAGAKSGILGHAASAAAAVYDQVAQIPYVGWILAPPAAAVAFAAVAAYQTLIPQFDVGTPFVPQDMVAMIHKGERIIPAGMNDPDSLAHGGGGRGDTYNINISAVDAASVSRLFNQNSGALVGALSNAKRNGAVIR